MPFEFARRVLVVTALLALPEPENLQYFPEDTDPGQLIRTMRGFTSGLGVPRILEFEPENARVHLQIEKLSNPAPEPSGAADS